MMVLFYHAEGRDSVTISRFFRSPFSPEIPDTLPVLAYCQMPQEGGADRPGLLGRWASHMQGQTVLFQSTLPVGERQQIYTNTQSVLRRKNAFFTNHS